MRIRPAMQRVADYVQTYLGRGMFFVVEMWLGWRDSAEACARAHGMTREEAEHLGEYVRSES